MKELFDNFYSACGCTEEDVPNNTPNIPSDSSDCDDWILKKVGYAQAYVPFQKFKPISEADQGWPRHNFSITCLCHIKKGTGLATIDVQGGLKLWIEMNCFEIFPAWILWPSIQHCFLDTHPEATEAISEYNKIIRAADTVRAKYEENYGPLCSFRSFNRSEETFQWIDNPWPWEESFNFEMTKECE